ncbi:MAG: SDR family NAD(P)-dependent oxidoreductase [Euryarchaeota archaeon]|nr:SDR family NAD(P)-dependent oxidoreductase [Euryarchaeota archaeon]
MGYRPDRRPTNLDGKQALVTGASAGIGKATAVALAARGANVVLVGRRRDRLDEVAELIHGKGGTAWVLPLDVTDQEAIDAALKTHASYFTKTDILVNNAGLAKGVDKVQKSDPEHWATMMDTNVLGLLRMTRAIVSHMVERGEGHIVNLGSVAGRWVYPGGAVYCASKFAVRALTEGMRLDLHGTGIRVTNISPGLVETEFSIVRLQDRQKADKVYDRTTPLVAEDIADCILWTLERPAHVNIQEMVVYPTDQAAVQAVHRYEREGQK